MSAFDEVRLHAGGGHAQMTELNLVLDAITEVIMERRKTEAGGGGGAAAASVAGGTEGSAYDAPTATEYFAALMTALEANQHVPQLLSLLARIMPEVPSAVLRATFGGLAKSLQRFAKMAATAEGEQGQAALRSVLSCIGTVLAAQATASATWERPETLRLFHALLAFITDGRPKVRRAAQEGVAAVLRVHRAARFAGLAVHVASFVRKVLEGCTVGDCTRTLQLLVLLRDVLPLLPLPALRDLAPSLVALLRLGHPMLAAHALSAIGCIVRPSRTDDPDSDVDAALVGTLLQGVLSAPPGLGDLEAASTVCTTLPVALERLRGLSAAAADAALPPTCAALCAYFESDYPKLHGDAAAALTQAIARGGLEAGRLQAEAAAARGGGGGGGGGGTAAAAGSVVGKLCGVLEQLLQPRYHKGWSHALPLLAAVFRHFGTAADPLLRPLCVTLAAVAEAVQASPASPANVRKGLDEAVGAAIEAMGPGPFLAAVPLLKAADAANAAVGGLSPGREWLLPRLKDSVGRGEARSSLVFFRDHILGLARRCEAAKGAEGAGVVERRRHAGHCMQLWALLPGFCLQPVDIAFSFKQIARIFKQAMEDDRYPDLLVVCCAGLQALIKGTKLRLGASDDDDDDDDDDDGAGGGNPMAAAAQRALALARRQQQLGTSSRAVGGARGAGATVTAADAAAAAADLAELQNLAKNFLPLLFKLYEGLLSKQQAQQAAAVAAGKRAAKQGGAAAGSDGVEDISSKTKAVSDAVAAYASIAKPGTLPTIFKQLIQKLLQASTDAADAEGGGGMAAMRDHRSDNFEERKAAQARTSSLMGLVLALVPSLEEENLSLLMRVIRPQLLDDGDPVMQKKSYTALLAMCKHHRGFLLGTADDEDKEEEEEEEDDDGLGLGGGGGAPSQQRLHELFAMLGGDSLLSCPAGAKRLRLGCLTHVVHVLDAQSAAHTKLLGELVGEVMLCTKEPNRRARAAAFELLDAIAAVMARREAYGRSGEEGHTPDGLVELSMMVMGGLAATTPHMRSAAIMSLSRLVYKYASEERLAETLPGLLETVLLCLREKAREVIKSSIGFVKVMMAVLSPGDLEPHLPAVVEGLMLWAGDAKNRFRAKIKVMLTKLCRKFGYDAIQKLVPEGDERLVSHIKKEKARQDKRAKAAKAQSIASSSGGKRFDELVDSDDEYIDSDDDMTIGGRTMSMKSMGAGGSIAGRSIASMRSAARSKAATAKSAAKSAARSGGARTGVNVGSKRSRSRYGGSDDEDATWLREAPAGDAAGTINLLDPSGIARNQSSQDPKRMKKRAAAMADPRRDLTTDTESGRIIVPADDAAMELALNPVAPEKYKGATSGQQWHSHRRETDMAARAKKAGNGGKQRQDTHSASRFASKKAKGDVSRKDDQLKPYAYLPLDPKMMSARNKRDAVGQFQKGAVGTRLGKASKRKEGGTRGKRSGGGR